MLLALVDSIAPMPSASETKRDGKVRLLDTRWRKREAEETRVGMLEKRERERERDEERDEQRKREREREREDDGEEKRIKDDETSREV